MEKRTKGKVLRVWFICGLCLCALFAGKWLIFGDAAPRLRLVEEIDCVSGGKPVVECRMVNPSAKYVYHGSEFHVERWNEATAAWEHYDESKWDVNFTLPLYILGPFGRDTREYPVWIYGEDFTPGRYRIVQHARVGGRLQTENGIHIPDEEELTLTCEFTIMEQ